MHQLHTSVTRRYTNIEVASDRCSALEVCDIERTAAVDHPVFHNHGEVDQLADRRTIAISSARSITTSAACSDYRIAPTATTPGAWCESTAAPVSFHDPAVFSFYDRSSVRPTSMCLDTLSGNAGNDAPFAEDGGAPQFLDKTIAFRLLYCHFGDSFGQHNQACSCNTLHVHNQNLSRQFRSDEIKSADKKLTYYDASLGDRLSNFIV